MKGVGFDTSKLGDASDFLGPRWPQSYCGFSWYGLRREVMGCFLGTARHLKITLPLSAISYLQPKASYPLQELISISQDIMCTRPGAVMQILREAGMILFSHKSLSISLRYPGMTLYISQILATKLLTTIAGPNK